MTALTFSPQEMRHAERVVHIIPNTLRQRGLTVPPAEALLTRDKTLGAVVLWRMDTYRMGKLEPYTDPNVLHQLSTNLRGWPVIVCNRVGLAYGVLLGGARPVLLPNQADFPGAQRDQMLLAVNAAQETLALPFKELGHMLVVGATGSGKSTFLRLLVFQALQHGCQLALADLDNNTFPMLAHHPALVQPIAASPADVEKLLQWLTGEIERRQKLYVAAPNFPENLDEYNAQAPAPAKLPRLFVVLDEISATLTTLGGPKSETGQTLATLGWRARKFGLTLVLAGQDFRKEVVGAIKESLTGPTFAFRLKTIEAARNVGLPGAEKITQPGRALTDRWGLVQTLYLPKTELITPAASVPLTDDERRIIKHLLRHHAGQVSIKTLATVQIAEREGRRLCEEWDARGWTAKDPQRANGRYLQPTVLNLFSAQNRPNRPGRPDRLNPDFSGQIVISGVSKPVSPATRSDTGLAGGRDAAP